MFDFYFGTEQEIKANESRYLLFIKRMLPRWCNSIPDSEYLAIWNALNSLSLGGRKPILVETGVGASTIVLLHFALKFNGVLYSWDLNPSKGAFLRSLFVDSLLNHHKKALSDHWKFVPASSLSPELGIGIVKELGHRVDFAFLDSEHTARVLLGEVACLVPLMGDGSVLAIDDANYNYRHTNVAYINMQRKKLGLSPVSDPPDNVGPPFHEAVGALLAQSFPGTERLDDTYKKEFSSDIFWAYYNLDRAVMGQAGMEKMDDLKHRFDAWRISSSPVQGTGKDRQ